MTEDNWGQRLAVAAVLLNKAINHTDRLAALLMYQNELVAGLDKLFGRNSPTVEPAKILLGEIDLLLGRRKSNLLRTADRPGTQLLAAEHVIRLRAAIALDLYRRSGLKGAQLYTKVAKQLTLGGCQTRKPDKMGSRSIKAGTVEDWSQELHPLGKLKAAHEAARDVLADFPVSLSSDTADALVKLTLKTV